MRFCKSLMRGVYLDWLKDMLYVCMYVFRVWLTTDGSSSLQAARAIHDLLQSLPVPVILVTCPPIDNRDQVQSSYPTCMDKGIGSRPFKNNNHEPLDPMMPYGPIYPYRNTVSQNI